MDFLKSFFDGDNDEILFFIVVFLLIFNGSIFNRDNNSGDDRSDSGSILFFIVLFLLLFFSTDNTD